MGLVIVTGGTTASSNGTAISQGTGSTPLTFTTLSSVVSAHCRTESGECSDLTFSGLPTGVSISFDNSHWYTSSHILGVGATQASVGTKNYPVYFKQTQGVLVATSSFTTTGTYGAGTAPSLSGTLTCTAGPEKVTLSGPTSSDNVGIDHYVIEYGTSASYGSTQTVSSTSTTFPSTEVTSLTAGTLYYFRLKAYDAAGNASSGVTGTATPTTSVQGPSTVSAASYDFLCTSVTFSAVTDATSYNLYYTTDGSTPTTSSTKVTGVTSPYAHNGQTSGTTYKYGVTAVVGGTESLMSAQIGTASPTTLDTVTFERNALPGSPFSTAGGTTPTVQGTTYKNGAYAVSIQGAGSGGSWNGKLCKSVTMHSSGSKTFTTWYRTSGSVVSEVIVLGISPDTAVSDWNVCRLIVVGANIKLYYGATAGTMSNVTVYASHAANTWYRAVVTVNATADTVSAEVFNASGTSLGSQSSKSIGSSAWHGASKYLIRGDYGDSSSVYLYVDDLTDQL